MIKGILFDKDGTLLKFDELWNEATKMVMPKFLHKIGIDADEENVSMAVKSVGNSIAAMTYRDMTKAVIEFFEIEADDKMLSLNSLKNFILKKLLKARQISYLPLTLINYLSGCRTES